MIFELRPSWLGDRLVPYSCLIRVLVFIFLGSWFFLASWLRFLPFLNCLSLGDNFDFPF